jgi:integrase
MATIRKLRGRWQAMVRRKGLKPRARSFDAKADAERWARELETQVDRYGWALDTRPAESTTPGDVLLRYSNEVSSRKRGARQEQERLAVLRRHELAHRTMAGVTSAEIASYRDQRLKQVAPATVLRELALLSHVFEVAMSEWHIHLARNPVKQVRRPSVSDSRSRRLSADEEQRLLDACEAGRTPCLSALVVVAAESGMRRGELLALRWSDVDLEFGVAHLRMTKNGTSRDVPLSPRAIRALRGLGASQAGSDERPFPLTPGALEQAWRRLCARAGIQGLRFHDLRHEGLSRLAEQGLSITELASVSGHRTLGMLGRYIHHRAEDIAARLS